MITTVFIAGCKNSSTEEDIQNFIPEKEKNQLVCTGQARTCFIEETDKGTQTRECEEQHGITNIILNYDEKQEKWLDGTYEEIYFEKYSTIEQLNASRSMCKRNNCVVEKIGKNIKITQHFEEGAYPDYNFQDMIKYFEKNIDFASQFNYKCK